MAKFIVQKVKGGTTRRVYSFNLESEAKTFANHFCGSYFEQAGKYVVII